MFARIRIIGRGAGRLLRTLIIALLAAIAGCDRRPRGAAWGPTPGCRPGLRTPMPLRGATAMAMPG